MSDFFKSGEFIAKVRKEMGLTQQDLASRIGVGDKTVSKWERGINVPDIIILKKIAVILNVEVDEILNGERNAKLSPRIVSMYENKTLRYILFSIFGIILMLLFSFFMYFFNNFDKFKVYRFKGTGNNYELTGNIYQASNKYKMVVDDFIVYDTDKYKDLKIDTYKISIFINDAVVYSITEGKTSEQDNLNNEYFKYNDIVDKVNKSDLIIQKIGNNDTSEGYIEVLLITGGKSYTETFDFKNSIQERNNAFFYDKEDNVMKGRKK